ncbi:MAG: hypothetical protein IJ728_14150 [Selenomonadaceae bacterium]|nr:hypothetical protein [Selenomonadaceae bacterium]
MALIVSLVFMVSVLVFTFIYLRNSKSAELNFANVASSLGVMLTFAGIAYGLFNFNTADLETGVPELLEGMKTAFITSIIGMMISIACKSHYYRKQSINKNQVSDDAKISDLIEYLTERDKLIDERQKDFIDKLTNSIVGDGDYTVIGQIKTLRLEMSDAQRDLREEIKNANELLINEFNIFAKNMAENNSKAFIEALNSTIREFNDKIQEQFGDNFKQLNYAVGNLLKWQENYKDTIEKTNQNQLLIYKTLSNAVNSLNEIEKSASNLTKAAEDMQNLIVTSDIYSKKLNDEIKILQDTANDAKEIAPAIQSLCERALVAMNSYIEDAVNDTSDNVTEICNLMTNKINNDIHSAISQIKTYSETTHKEILSLTEILQTNISEVDDHIQKSQQEINKLTRESVHSIESISTAVAATSQKQRQDIDRTMILTRDSIKQAADKLSASSLEITKRISAELEQMMKINNENLKQSSKNVSESLNNTLNKSLEDFGTFLIKISQGFANDYTPLVNQLREVLLIAEKIKSGGKK